MAETSPMVQQYHEIKKSYKDAILFFRLGDFYEMFNEDAELASRELGLTLTGRGQNENRMPMAGIPYHAATSYIAKLIEKGHRVAICEQVEDPKLAKGLVKREIIKVITPGTVLEETMLAEKVNNYLAALAFLKDGYSLAYVDISTGDFKVTQISSKIKLLDEIERISPAECLSPDIFPDEEKDILQFLKSRQIVITQYKDVYDLGDPVAAIRDYLKETQKIDLSHLKSPQFYSTSNFLVLDASTRRNLELTQTIRDKSFMGSLLWVLDSTLTPMGGRLLRQWLLEPILNEKEINLRLDTVTELTQESILRAELKNVLKDISDIERLTARIASGAANAKDLVAVKETLKKLPKLKELLKNVKSKLLSEAYGLPDLKEVIEIINNAIADDPPFVLKEGGLIKQGFNPELDELKKMSTSGKDWIAALEDQERKRTGIKSLKVGFTRVFGYYLEVTTANSPLVPQDYIRKQTLVNSERFITPELKEKEALILNAEERSIELEYSIFNEIREKVSAYSKDLQKIAEIIGQVDVFTSLAEKAVENNYTRPKIIKGKISITAGRHPVVEKTQGSFKFVPNDTLMEAEKHRFLMITGPNMGGKSTYMRQVALIILMAQMGSFVPASQAEISVVDRIFTRVGAFDDLYAGQSTFMVEMVETAAILNHATDKSFIILDEIGRGTSTFDGMSIAAAVAEYIHEKVKAKTLFATHYHELTELTKTHPGMENYNMAVKQLGDRLTFLYRVVPGAADKSYGIQVAKLAGLPEKVIERAKKVYANLEKIETNLDRKSVQMGLFT